MNAQQQTTFEQPEFSPWGEILELVQVVPEMPIFIVKAENGGGGYMVAGVWALVNVSPVTCSYSLLHIENGNAWYCYDNVTAWQLLMWDLPVLMDDGCAANGLEPMLHLGEIEKAINIMYPQYIQTYRCQWSYADPQCFGDDDAI